MRDAYSGEVVWLDEAADLKGIASGPRAHATLPVIGARFVVTSEARVLTVLADGVGQCRGS
jgi:hypothetical protein